MGVEVGGTVQGQECHVIPGNCESPFRSDGGLSKQPAITVGEEVSLQVMFPMDLPLPFDPFTGCPAWKS